MKILVIGLGSMGKRRIRLLIENFQGVSICGVDSREDRRIKVAESFGINIYENLEEAITEENPEVAFICTSPLSHPSLTLKCLQKDLNIFSEINLINENHEELLKESRERNKLLFVSSTPLYRKEIQYITERVNLQKKPLNYIYHVGQYLPDWHPWENYKDFFVGDKRTNGCRELFCIELPWIIKAFGCIKDFNCVRSNNSELKLDYPDNYIVTINHDSGNKGVLCIDVVSRKSVRNLNIYGEDINIDWGGTPDTLKEYNIQNKINQNIQLYDKIEKDLKYADNIIENMYIDEMKAFFKCMRGQTVEQHILQDDIEMLSVLDKFEEQ